jgi:hypothetical protein
MLTPEELKRKYPEGVPNWMLGHSPDEIGRLMQLRRKSTTLKQAHRPLQKCASRPGVDATIRSLSKRRMLMPEARLVGARNLRREVDDAAKQPRLGNE